MKKHLVTIVLVSAVVLLSISSIVLLAKNLELTRTLDEADELIIGLYDEMFDVMDDENLVAMYLAQECGIYDSEIELTDFDDDELVGYIAYENGEIIHGGYINRDYYKNYFKYHRSNEN